MQYQCLYCLNTDKEKFAPTKRGPICLCCYEVKTQELPENETEKAVIAIREHMKRSTGGNNRNWTKAYRALVNKADFLNQLTGKTQEQEIFARAYMDAIKTFEEAVK